MLATGWGMPVSTTQTVVGALIGVGFASGASIKWNWESGSVSQVAASWAIAPLIAGGFSALIFGVLKYSVLERSDPFKWGMRLIPVYFALTGAILALFIVVEAPTAPSLEEFGAGKAAGIILGVFFGCLLICYVFFMPFFKRKLIMKDPRVRIWHVVLGPMLIKENTHLFWPGKGDEYVTNYYEDAYGEVRAKPAQNGHTDSDDVAKPAVSPDASLKAKDGELPSDPEKTKQETSAAAAPLRRKKPEPYERFIGPVKHLSWFNPQKWWGYFKFIMLQGPYNHLTMTFVILTAVGVTRDVITHDSDLLRAIHSKAKHYDIHVEHLWTYCQVVSAMMMSIAHGSNDVANAVGKYLALTTHSDMSSKS